MNSIPYAAPDFSLQNSQGTTVSLSDFQERWLVVYFYPKDDTPGCTIEACSIRDTHAALTEHGIAVVGISQDDMTSHANFSKKYSLNFDILSDPNGEVIKAYGAWGKKMFGREGILRKTYIIDPDGQVVKVYGRVTPIGHGDQLLRDIQALQKK
jgi:peroxiredoxin Q/BCP